MYVCIYLYIYIYINILNTLCSVIMPMVQWIPHGGPIELFLIPASAPQLVNKGWGICYPVSGMMHVKDPLLKE